MGRPMVIILCCGVSEEMSMIQPEPEAVAGSELSELLRKYAFRPRLKFWGKACVTIRLPGRLQLTFFPVPDNPRRRFPRSWF